MNTPENLILEGIVGSTAYGLATPESDVDIMGVYAAPTSKLHGLHPPPNGRGDTVVHIKPDAVYHEALKFVNLVMVGNPSVTELLWLEDYEHVTPLGDWLLNRRHFLSAGPRIATAYLGYAHGQFIWIEKRIEAGPMDEALTKYVSKKARHLLRLLYQGYEFYSTGHLTVRLENPEQYHEFGETVARDGKNGLALLRHVMDRAEDDFDQVRSPLPDRPDDVVADQWLQLVRLHYWQRTEHV